MSTPLLLELTGITKLFGGVHALSDVNLSARKGEVRAVVGENGAGKSTLMKIVAGAIQPDSGTIRFEDRVIHLKEPRDASRLGISTVYQEPSFFDELSVLENLYLGSELKTPTGSLDWRRMTDGSRTALEALRLPTDIIGKPMGELSLGLKQLVLISRSIHYNVKLLILDEPTAILSSMETEILFSVIRELKTRGVSVLYISHRIQEIFMIADSISVLRDGKLVADYPIEGASEDVLISAMSGREMHANIYAERGYRDAEPILEVENLSLAGSYENVSFSLRPGEVLGLYGLVGAGRSEVARAIYGEMPADTGTILFRGGRHCPRSSSDSIAKGIIYVVEDRRLQGLFPLRSVRDNLSVSRLRDLAGGFGSVNKRKEDALARGQVENLAIKTTGLAAGISSLSGGNQQKVVLGRSLTLSPRVLILDEPTHGIDVGTKNEIHRLIMSLAAQEIGIILISSDLTEVLALADRFLIMHEGLVMGQLDRREAGEESILRLALGLQSRSSQV